MATRETRRERGLRRGRELVRRLVNETMEARKAAGISQRQLAHALGRSQSEISRLERLTNPDSVTVVELAAINAVLGCEISAGRHPAGDPIRDKGQQALGAKFRTLLSAAIRVVAEVRLPGVGDRRSWDLLLRIGAQLVGVELETRVRDIQWLVRRLRERERDGGVDCLLLVLSDSQINRRLLPQLLEALGPEWTTPPRTILAALRAGRPLPGSAVILL